MTDAFLTELCCFRNCNKFCADLAWESELAVDGLMRSSARRPCIARPTALPVDRNNDFPKSVEHRLGAYVIESL